VREEVLHRHAVVDQREVAAEQGTSGRRELQPAFLDEADDGERREAFRPARDPEARVDLVRDLKAAMRETVRLLQLDPVAAVDPNDAREPGLGSEGVEIACRLTIQRARSSAGLPRSS
jgi:hypothetical protein